MMPPWETVENQPSTTFRMVLPMLRRRSEATIKTVYHAWFTFLRDAAFLALGTDQRG